MGPGERSGFVAAPTLTRFLAAPVAALTLVIGAGRLHAQGDAASEPAGIFVSSCASCHGEAQSGRTPSGFSLSQLSPRAIVAALETGAMRTEGEALTREQRIALAEHLTGRPYARAMLPEAAFCPGHGFAPVDPGRVAWMGYGGNPEGTGFQPAERAGLSAEDVPHLRLRWAFGFPDASQVRTKPTVVGDAVLVGGPYGEVLALDAATGCVRWAFEADAGVRTSILVGTAADGRTLAWFVDFRTNAYALDPATGSVVWKTRVGWHPESNTTGGAVLHGNRLIVPISSMEVVTAGSPAYACCTSSGAVAALDATTGELVWYHRVIAEDASEVGRNAAGTPILAPSGAPVWSSPTIDVRRGRVYVGTGENYTRPTTANSDAILAIDLESGELAWSFQGLAEDAFTMACTTPRNRENCPAPPGPDLDFGMAPMLVARPDGREILVVGQKSGMVYALDPDAEGTALWSTQVGKGGALGGIHWGMATDGRQAYAANADRGAVIVDVHPDRAASPGLYALDLMTGEVAWSAPAPANTCEGRNGCFAAYSAAPTVIPGVVFTGGLDGYVRAYASSDGRLLWEYDTVREFETVGGVPGRGGAIDGPGPVVANGLLLVNSGYGSFGQMPGNVLLAFEVPTRQQQATIPRLPSGVPDLNGLWQALGNAHWDIEPHAARPALALQPGPVVPVPANEVLALGTVASVPSGWGIVEGGEIPYTAEARARRDENRERWLERDPEIRCYLPGVPRATYMPFPFRIFHSASHVFFAYEYASATRNIHLEDPGPPQVDSWMGQSVGRWEGDTFVVETTGFNGETWLDRAGNHHSAGLKVTERFTLIGPDHMQYEATMDDPATFTRPWTIRLPLYRHIDPDARLGQFKCVEFVEELMYGHLRKHPIR